jgi:hypothetical protein
MSDPSGEKKRKSLVRCPCGREREGKKKEKKKEKIKN